MLGDVDDGGEDAGGVGEGGRELEDRIAPAEPQGDGARQVSRRDAGLDGSRVGPGEDREGDLAEEDLRGRVEPPPPDLEDAPAG